MRCIGGGDDDKTINMRNELRKRNSATVKTKLDAKVDEYNAIVAKV